MKKILFIQLKGNSFGGVWQVIKTIGSYLVDKNYEVHIVSLRENHNNIKLEYDNRLKLSTINKKDIWENTYFGFEIKKDIKKMHLIAAIKKIIVRIKHEISIKSDKKKLRKYIFEYNPDYIITAHYELLDMIPKTYLDKTYHHQHSSFADAKSNNANIKTFNKYKNKIHFIWLTEKTMKFAVKYGYEKSIYIYNPVRFKSSNRAEVIQNKKLITIARLSADKSIDKMIDIVENVFKDKKYEDWSFEIYGKGDQEEILNNQIKNKKQIKIMGITNDPKRELLNSSINLNTSKFEGFSLSILEANECGVPTIAFDFGESASEQIIHEKTGIIAKNTDDYILKLKEIMDDNTKLERLSINCKDFSKNFYIENIIKKWFDLLK